MGKQVLIAAGQPFSRSELCQRSYMPHLLYVRQLSKRVAKHAYVLARTAGLDAW